MEIEKAKAFIASESLEYLANAVVYKTIIKKTMGSVSVASYDKGEVSSEKVSPYDVFIQVIDGSVEVVIDDILSILSVGQSIVVPAHTRNAMKANERFKIISTMIKNGYTDVS